MDREQAIKLMQDLLKRVVRHETTVILDPPRRGCPNRRAGDHACRQARRRHLRRQVQDVPRRRGARRLRDYVNGACRRTAADR